MLQACALLVGILAAMNDVQGAPGGLLPDGFENVKLGMTLQQLVKERPDVIQWPESDILSEVPREFRRVDADIPDQLVGEVLKGNAFFTHALYAIEGGKLGAISLSSWTDEPGYWDKQRAFLAFCVKRFGKAFEKRVKIDGEVPGIRFLVPVLRWRVGDAVVEAKVTPRLSEVVRLQEGYLVLSAWPLTELGEGSDVLMDIGLDDMPVTSELLEKVFSGIDIPLDAAPHSPAD